MNLTHRHYTLVLFALCTVIAASFGYFFLYKRTITQAEHHANAYHEVANESTKKQHEQELIGVHEDTSAERAKIASFFILEDVEVDFIEKIERIGVDSQTKLELSSISNDETQIRARVDVNGTWSGVMNALMLMENMPLSIVISDVRLDTSGDLESSGKKTGGHLWHLSLVIEALTRKSAQ